MINVAAYQRSIGILKKASTPHGFVASLIEHDNYKRIWTRDGSINSMAALLSGEPDLIETVKVTLHTIFRHQHASGFMPSNVTPGAGVSYGGTVGRADNPSWAVITLCQYALMQNDLSFAKQYLAQVVSCFSVMDAWEYNGKHLLYVPQSGDWADEYIQHGYVLFNQLLRIWALQLAARVFEREEWAAKAAKIREVVEINYWNRLGAGPLYAANLKHQLREAPQGYWLMGFNPARVYPQFDLQANALAIILGLGAADENRETFQYIQGLQLRKKSLVPSFYPSILQNDADMRELENNFAYGFRNRPHEFHNGGLWPVWNGLLVAAAVLMNDPEFAASITHEIELANEKNQHQYNECLQGESQEPIGVPYCTWSAGGHVIAIAYLEGKRLFT